MNNEQLLDENFIINNLTDILNGRPFKFKFRVKKYSKTSYSVITDQKFKNYFNECLLLEFKASEKGISIIVYILEKCVPMDNYGKYILECLKEFATKYGYYSVGIGQDSSSLIFKNLKGDNFENMVSVTLPYFSILMSGESWYNKMGFYNEENPEQIDYNKYIINKDISEIDDFEKITNLTKKSKLFTGNINSYAKFRELFNYILKITNTTQDNSIKEVFKGLYNYIRIHCDNGEERTCDLDYKTMQNIAIFIMHVYYILGLKYTPFDLEYIVNEHRVNQKAGKIKYKAYTKRNKGKNNRKYLKNKTKTNNKLRKKHK